LFFSFQQNSWSENLLTEFLVAKPTMPDLRFKESVIVIWYHNNEEGAAGLVVNKPIKTISIVELFKSNNIPMPKKIVSEKIKIYWGGPVNPNNIFFIHSSDYVSKNYIFSNKDFTITGAPEILFDIANNKGPKKYLILRGFSAWSPGQLDNEIIQEGWDKKINSYIPIFDNGKEMWERLINSKDI